MSEQGGIIKHTCGEIGHSVRLGATVRPLEPLGCLARVMYISIIDADVDNLYIDVLATPAPWVCQCYVLP
jgi:hypothetical protein